MKTLFLDFDGVLNSQPFLIEAHRIRKDWEHPSELDRWVSMIDPEAVELLNEIVERTNCVIVVSSSWRIVNNRHDLQHFLELRGFSHSILGRTPSLGGRNRKRGHEIQAWLDDWEASHPDDLIESFAIVDDDSDMAHLMDKLVHTDFRIGMQRMHVEKIVSMLGGE